MAPSDAVTTRALSGERTSPCAVSTRDVAPQIAAASLACSTATLEFTIPQVVRLSQAAPKPLPAATVSARAAMFVRMIGPQTALTAVQFVLVRELRDALDRARPSPYNLSFAYGASAPFLAAKYNMVIAGVYAHGGRAAPAASGESWHVAARAFWRAKVAPGLVFSFLRDCGSVGGGIVAAPHATAALARATGGESVSTKVAGGLIAGALCGLGTQALHNCALISGRMAATSGTLPSAAEAAARLFAENGFRALYLNAQFRIGTIAVWTAVLHVMDPFRKTEA